jgi:hypothetical protein
VGDERVQARVIDPDVERLVREREIERVPFGIEGQSASSGKVSLPNHVTGSSTSSP